VEASCVVYLSETFSASWRVSDGYTTQLAAQGKSHGTTKIRGWKPLQQLYIGIAQTVVLRKFRAKRLLIQLQFAFLPV